MSCWDTLLTTSYREILKFLQNCPHWGDVHFDIIQFECHLKFQELWSANCMA